MNLTDWKSRGRYARIRGRRIFYVAEGHGPEALLIHGFPLASWGWRRIWPAITEGYRAIAPDLLGFGFSEKPPGGPYRVSDQADLLEELLSELGAAPPHVIAGAYGVTVAQELLARQRERARPLVRSVCFLNGGLFPEANPVLPSQRLLLSPVGPLLFRFVPFPYFFFRRSVKRMFGRRPPSEADLRELWRLVAFNGGTRVMHELMGYLRERKVHRDRWVGGLRGADVPIRLVLGAADPISGGQAERWRETIVDVEPVVLDSVGHYPQLEAPRVVVDTFDEMAADDGG